MKLAQRAYQLQESAIRKLDASMHKYPHVSFLRLNIGQPDIETPPQIRQAIQNWNAKVISYGPASGTIDCRTAFADYHRKWQAAITVSN